MKTASMTACTTPSSMRLTEYGTPPSTPGNVTATAASSSQVNLTWTASTDNIGVTGYHVYRNGTQLQTPTPPDATPPTAYTDDTAQPGTAYTYQVSAVDAAGNESPTASATVSTPSAGGTLTFTPTDDATVDSSQPTVNLGTNSRLTVDNSPINYSLLKFTVAGTGGCPITAETTTHRRERHRRQIPLWR